MKLAIVGSRSIGLNMTAELAAKDILHGLRKEYDIDEVVSGKCKDSPDMWGAGWAKANAIKLTEYPAQWRVNGRYNPRAGFDRNKLIVRDCDMLVAFWDGKSNGTRDDFRLCEENHKSYIIYKWNPNKWVFEITTDWR
jgi:uncharacterized phage-like protein YoqJ